MRANRAPGCKTGKGKGKTRVGARQELRGPETVILQQREKTRQGFDSELAALGPVLTGRGEAGSRYPGL